MNTGTDGTHANILFLMDSDAVDSGGTRRLQGRSYSTFARIYKIGQIAAFLLRLSRIDQCVGLRRGNRSVDRSLFIRSDCNQNVSRSREGHIT